MAEFGTFIKILTSKGGIELLDECQDLISLSISLVIGRELHVLATLSKLDDFPRALLGGVLPSYFTVSAIAT